MAKRNGFTVKRNFCYRKIDDGILQFIKFEFEPRFSKHVLRIGLYSLYSELRPHWFTPGGCILRYSACAFSNTPETEHCSPILQIELLPKYVFPWLNSMHTQRDLVEAMCEIEAKEYGKVLWVDSLKIAPFLACKDYIAADRVISSILHQHTGPDAWTSQYFLESDYEIYKARYPGKDLQLIEIHDWIKNKDYSSIDSYLQSNIVINSNNITFI